MPEWTPAQQSAINAKNSNILVSAAAGSGKTAVLTERVIRLITDETKPVMLDGLLVVTFTNAAAAEMRTRISKRLTEIIKKEPNNTNALRQLSLVPSSQICTIDSFCMKLVRDNFFKLDISQDFNILDNSQQLLLEQNTAEEIVEDLYSGGSEEFRALTELLSSSKNDSGLISTVKRINDFISSQPYPIEWLKKAGDIYNPSESIDESSVKAYVVGEIGYYLDYILKVIEECFSLLETDEMYSEYYDALSSDKETVNALLSSLNKPWNELRLALRDCSFVGTPRAPRGFNPPYKKRLLGLRRQYAGSDGIIKKCILPLVAPSEEDIKEDNEKLCPVFNSLIELVSAYNDRLLEKKKELNAYSFSDIEHFAIQLLLYPDENGILRKTDFARELTGSYYEILVDEYQDTNTAQDDLFDMLSNGSNRFMVGDVKQSIYRFRLAMPSIFIEKRNTFSPYDEGSDERDKKIVLDKNFRSRKGICDFTNFLFSNLMSSRVGEINYGEEDYLINGSPFPDTDVPCAQLNIIDVPEGENAVEYEARHIASEIIRKNTSGEMISEKGVMRRLTYGDIAVLMRSAKRAMPVFVKVFSEYGIPVVANNRINLFNNNEVAILMSLLRVVDNPVRDVPLLSVLMSVFYGYTADDIARARVNNKADNLYSSICLDGRFERFVTDLERYRSYAASMSVESLIRQILSDTSYLSLIAAMGNFEQRRLNVMKLVEIAKLFDSGESVGLTAFLRYADRLREDKLEVESAEPAVSGENAVKLMSVHRSKGLEFPVVILAGASRRYNNEDSREAVLMNHELGVGLKVNDSETLSRYDSLQYSIIKSINGNASMSENLRVLYVAVTRAKEQFIAFASYKNAAGHIASVADKIIGGKIPPFAVERALCDGDLLLMCAVLHRDSGDIRQMLSLDLPYASEFDFDMSIRFISSAITPQTEEIIKAEPDGETVEKIAEKLSFAYEGLPISAYAAKRTASSLDRSSQDFKYFASSKPAFLSDGELTAAQKGTAMHAFMQFCDYGNAKSDLESEISSLTENGFITSAQADSLSRSSLNALFSSDFAKRIFESERVYRELKVSSFLPLSELEDTERGDFVLVQGIADCVFEEDGELVVVDYKTDKIESGNELKTLYKNQLSFYKLAVERTLKRRVKECVLYSFSNNKYFKY